jgi:hypothetical protein
MPLFEHRSQEADGNNVPKRKNGVPKKPVEVKTPPPREEEVSIGAIVERARHLGGYYQQSLSLFINPDPK